MLTNILMVAAGSAAGGVLRYLASLAGRAWPAPLPYWTLAVNVLGGFAIGLFAAWLTDSVRLKLLLVTGFCGGFTTFSAFSLETLELFQQGASGWGLLNIGLNVFLSIGACLAGYSLITE